MTDQRMPEMTGVEFLKHARGEHPEAIRLLFTGYADIRAVIDAINQGNVYRYITKPWDPDELQAVIREACERYDLIVERSTCSTCCSEQNSELEQANAELRRGERAEVRVHPGRQPRAAHAADRSCMGMIRAGGDVGGGRGRAARRAS